MRFSKMIMATTDELDGEKFYTVKEGKRLATPLLTCLVCIELSDFVFAVDSIPAVLGVSKDPFIGKIHKRHKRHKKHINYTY
jgi:predicted tellurium resistance membrane protein TerC